VSAADRFTVVAGVAAPLMRPNIDTDTVIRIERLTNTEPKDTAPWLFEALRFDAEGRENPDFVLNQPPFRDAPILLAGENFGCGSSREGAVWALKHSGIRCVIAPSFGDIFANNCFQNFVLPVVLPAEQVTRLAEQCAGGNARVTVDLERQMVISPHGEEMPFEIQAIRRTALLEGLDEIGLTMLHAAAIAAFQANDRAARPWVWQPGEGGDR
jgi:3-isopropylmalate/(R)-2-methylmalate dehydratase small subunit